MLSVALIEDEPLARLRAKDLLSELDDVRVVGEAATADDAKRLLLCERPDVAVVDIELPDGSGFDLVAALPADATPLLIFLTAFDHYAARAFDINAVDYVLKPVRRERLHSAIGRVQDHLRSSSDVQRPLYIAVPTEDGMISLVAVASIDYIESAGNYVQLHWGKQHLFVRERISSIEARLDSRQFVRLHRTVIANLERIDVLEPSSFGDYHARMKSGAVVPLSRRYRERIPLLAGRL